MAVWDPPQPVWKRNLAGFLDLLLASFGAAVVVWALGLSTRLPDGNVNFGPGALLLLLVMVVGYFVGLGRSGGTVFQRVFAMKRAAPGEPAPPPSAGSPLWRYNLAAILDLLLASSVFSVLLAGLGLNQLGRGPQGSFTMQLEYGPALVLVAYVVAYFVGLQRTGGTMFQRLLRITRKSRPGWDPPQSAWKRRLAGILDFVLAAVGFWFVLTALSPGIVLRWVGPPEDPAINLAIPWQVMLLPAAIVGYFAVLGGTGGTVFQRLFAMKRGKMSKKDDAIARQF